MRHDARGDEALQQSTGQMSNGQWKTLFTCKSAGGMAADELSMHSTEGDFCIQDSCLT